MRNIINIAFSFLILLSVSGISINQHFCKDQLVDVHTGIFDSVKQQNHDCCDDMTKNFDERATTCDVDDENEKCPYCHDKELQLKVKDYFVTTDFNYEFKQQAGLVKTLSYEIVVSLFFTGDYHNLYNRFIPPDTRTYLSFLNRYLL